MVPPIITGPGTGPPLSLITQLRVKSIMVPVGAVKVTRASVESTDCHILDKLSFGGTQSRCAGRSNETDESSDAEPGETKRAAVEFQSITACTEVPAVATGAHRVILFTLTTLERNAEVVAEVATNPNILPRLTAVSAIAARGAVVIYLRVHERTS